MRSVRGGMTIGELARRAGVNVETVRYYQRCGLLPEPPRGRGFRRYTEEVLTTLRFIRRLKGLGFRLREMNRLIALRRQRADVRPALAVLLRDKQIDLERKLREQQIMIRAVEELRRDVLEATPDEAWRPFE